MTLSFTIGDRRVGPGSPCLIVAEIAQTHDGSLGTAHAYIDAVAKSGADAIKFQTHIASAESTPDEPFRVKFSPQDATRFHYWQRMEFTEAQWRGLAEHARECGLIFLSTPFSFEAIDLLERLALPAWKVGSGEVTNLPMLERLAATGLPVLLSSGMASWDELDRAASVVRPAAPLAILQCTSAYPCPAERVGLNILGELRERYGCPAGLSDHSGVIFAGLAAVALTANLLEVHVVFSRECFGPDVAASLTTTELKTLVEGTRFIEAAIAKPVDKTAVAGEMTELKALFGKSIVVSKDLAAGHRIAPGDLTLKKPGTGIPAARLADVFGRHVKHSVAAGTFLSEADID